MGIFDKKNNKNSNVDEPNQDATLNTGEEIEDRFVLVVESATNMLDGNGVVVSGKLHGSVHAGTKVHIINPGNKIVSVDLVQVESKDDEGKLVMDKAVDTPVQMQLASDVPFSVSKFAVITSIRPQMQMDVSNAIENPFCSAFLYELKNNAKDPSYTGIMQYALAHCRFISPVHFEHEPVKGEDGKEVFEQDTRMGFFMLKAPADLPRNENEDSVLPVFTDWDALKKSGFLSDEKKVRTMIFTFQNLVDIVNTPQCAGFVINPQCENTLTVTKALIKTITSNKGYQQDFGQKAPTNIKPDQIKKDEQVMIGIPAESEEITNIKAELATYGRLHAQVKSISLLRKASADGVQRHLIMLDIPKENSKEIMQEIYDAIKDYAISCSAVEFVIRGTNTQLDAVADKYADRTLAYSAFVI